MINNLTLEVDLITGCQKWVACFNCVICLQDNQV